MIDEIKSIADDALVDSSSVREHTLARFIVQVAPLIRICERLCDNFNDTSGSFSRIDGIEDGVRDISSAISKMREELGRVK